MIQEVNRLGPNANLNHIDVSGVSDFSHVFTLLDWNGDISLWDTSNARHMIRTFGQTRFNGDISKWNTSKVEFMQNLFEDSQFNGDISKWDVSSVQVMNWMFADSQFDGDISQWNVSNVGSMIGMFDTSVFKGDLRSWELHPDIYASYVFGTVLAVDASKAASPSYEDDDVVINDHATTPYFSKIHLLHMLSQDLSFMDHHIEHQRQLCQQFGLSAYTIIERLYPMFSSTYQHTVAITAEASFSF